MKNTNPKECIECGQIFTPKSGCERKCPDCRNRKNRASLGKAMPVTNYNLEVARIRKEAAERAKHTEAIVADGYAERQIEKSLRLAGKINTEL